MSVAGEPVWKRPAVVVHTTCLVSSLKRWTGRDLVSGVEDPLDLARRIYLAPFVVVSHGTERDPLLNYGNAAALKLWEMGWDQLLGTPSRFTAEAPDRKERARLLEAVTRHGYIDDYSGVRISSTGRRFRISGATVWNLVTSSGHPCGQAAMFHQWEPL